MSNEKSQLLCYATDHGDWNVIGIYDNDESSCFVFVKDGSLFMLAVAMNLDQTGFTVMLGWPSVDDDHMLKHYNAKPRSNLSEASCVLRRALNYVSRAITP